MSLRMACESSDIITALVSFAGSTFADPAQCGPVDEPVSVLLLHGTADDVIRYEGGTTVAPPLPGGGPYPSANETARRFAERAVCDVDQRVQGSSIDVLDSLAGSETDVLTFTNCAPGATVSLWTLNDASHFPAPGDWRADSLDALLEFILSNPRAN